MLTQEDLGAQGVQGSGHPGPDAARGDVVGGAVRQPAGEGGVEQPTQLVHVLGLWVAGVVRMGVEHLVDAEADDADLAVCAPQAGDPA